MTTSGRAATNQRVETSQDKLNGMLSAEASSEQDTERALSDAVRRMIESVRPEAIFGSPVEREGVTVIPCSEVMVGFGMGGGGGSGPASQPRARDAERGSTAEASDGASPLAGGRGFGGGGGAQGRPVAVIAISNGNARVLPVMDATKFMIAALTTIGFATLGIAQGLARTRQARQQVVSPRRFARAMRANRTLRSGS